MAAAELPRPGVVVIQQLSTPAPTFVRPTLVPCVVGPAFEVIKVLNTDGTVNPKALYGTYAQLGLGITESAYPDPRNNIDELDVLEETIAPYMLAGGILNQLKMNPGSGFLTTEHGAGKAAIQSVVFGGGGLSLAGLTLVVAIDQPVRLNTTEDVPITFTGSGALSATQAAAQVNAAVGQTVASVVGTSPNEKLVIASPIFGALSSVTIRAGGSANSVLQIGYSGASAAHEERVEGSGWRGQDDNNNNTTTPWIEFYQGAYLLDGVDTAFVTKAGIYNIETPTTFTSAKAAAVTFGTAGGQIPMMVGDYFYADGLRVKNGEVAKVEASRFKIGTINTALSTADSNGNYIAKVYDIQEVGTLFDPSPFAPSYAYIRANGLDWRAVAPVAAADTGSVSGTAATAGVITGVGAGAGPFPLAGLTLHYVSIHNGVSTEGTFTFTGGPFANMAAVEAAIGSNIPHVAATDDAGSPPQLVLTTAGTGSQNSITIKKDGTANSSLGWSTSADTTGTGVDVTFTGLTGKTLLFSFDKNPHQYSVTFTSDSLDVAITDINNIVKFVVASKDNTGLALVLTSPLAGMASKVSIVDQSVPGPAGAEATFGFVPLVAPVAGSGRPFPDAYLDDALVLHINSELLRDAVTGYPLDQLYNTGSLYIQFTALRLDVSAVAKIAGVLRISDQATLSAVLDPITDENPLALGLFMAMINAPTFEVKGLGIDAVTVAAPTGTSDAWARAAGLLESEEVYSLAPLTQDDLVIQLWNTHVGVMSQPDQGGERIAFVNKLMPVRKNPTIALSGSNSNSTASVNQMLLDGDPTAGLVAAGISTPASIPEDAGVYLQFTVAGQVRNYNVSGVAGALVNLRTTFVDPANNADDFYSTVTLNVPVIDAAYVLAVRGASLVVPGSNPARLDYQLVAETVSDANAAFKDRRLYSVFPDTIKTTIQGIEKALPGYYACAAIAGMCGAQPPQQGFTNFPIAGLTGVVGTEKFTKSQLNIMAGGGTYILIQDAIGAPVVARHQLSTDLTSIETRELSITKVVDFVSKFLRSSVRKFIGTNVIDKNLLDTLGSTIHAALKFLEEVGVLEGSNINQLVQDQNNLDTVLVDITLDVPFPCNYIRITLVV